MNKKRLAVLTVIGNDRPGIIAAVTGVLYRAACNLEDITMTLLEDQFTMMLVADLPAAKTKKVERDLSALKKTWGLSFSWKDLKRRPKSVKAGPSTSVRHLITAIGRDQTGIVYKISQRLAKHNLNITDLNSQVLARGAKALYALALEVDIPLSSNLKALDRNLASLQRKLGIELNRRPVERIEL